MPPRIIGARVCNVNKLYQYRGTTVCFFGTSNIIFIIRFLKNIFNTIERKKVNVIKNIVMW